jgi:autotransporter-associated beta strand protein
MSFSISANKCQYPESQFQKRLLSFLVAVLLCVAANLQAQTWSSSPGTGDWNTASNWSSPSIVPNAQSAFATFGTSSTTSVLLSSGVSLDTLQFNGGASAFTINTNSNNVLALFGSGVANNSSAIQSLTVGSGGEIDFYNAASAGNANLTNTNNSYIRFFSNSNAGTATIMNNGPATLIFFGNSTAENASITNTSNGVVDFVDNATAGNSNIMNNGNLVFTGDSNGVTFSTAGSATITNNSTMSFNDYATAGNSRITNASSGTFDFSGDSTASKSNITNNGNLVFTGLGNGVTFSTAGSATITNNNTISFTDYSTAGKSNITNNGEFTFQQNSTAGNATITTNIGDVLFQNTASGGTARFIFNGTGYLDISGETLGNPVTIGSIEGSGSVSLGTNNLATGLNNLSTFYSGFVTDGGNSGGSGGSLTKIGTGTFTLSGANSYTGGTDINNGTLVAANSSALGTGSVVVSGGTLSLGGPRTLNIGGNYTQTSVGTLQLGLAGTTAGQWDNLNITGTTSLTGTLNLVLYNGFHVGRGENFELLDSTGGLTGTFGTIVDAIYEPVSIVYTPNEVILDTMTYSQFALTLNEKNIAGDLDNLAANTEDTTLLNALTALPTSSLLAAYDQISPSNLTPLYKMQFMSSQAQGNLVWQRLSEVWGNKSSNSTNMAWDGESPMFASNMSADQEVQIARGIQSNPWGGFLSGMGNFGTVTSDGNGAGYQFSVLGTTAGLDYRLAKDLVGGLLIGVDQSGSNQSTGTVNVTGGQVGLYAGWKSDEFHVDALIDGGIDSYSTQRTAFDGTANGSASGLEYTGQLNLGYDLSAANFLISPFVTGQYTQVNVNAFTETGSLAPLTYGNQGEGYISSDLGSQFSLKLKAGDIQLLPNISAAWEHVYQGNLDSLIANFGMGNNFTVYGSDTGTDAAVLGGGLNAEFSGGFSVYVDYQGTWGMTNFTEQSLNGGINIAFGGSKRGETHSIVKPAATPVVTPAASLPPIQYQAPRPLSSPAATPVVTVLPAPTQSLIPIEVPVDTPKISPTPFSLGPLVPTQGIITIQTPTATPVLAGSENRPF